jgi:hypothetical protein
MGLARPVRPGRVEPNGPQNARPTTRSARFVTTFVSRRAFVGCSVAMSAHRAPYKASPPRLLDRLSVAIVVGLEGFQLVGELADLVFQHCNAALSLAIFAYYGSLRRIFVGTGLGAAFPG